MEKILRLVRELDAALCDGNILDRTLGVNAMMNLVRKHSTRKNSKIVFNPSRFNDREPTCLETLDKHVNSTEGL